MAADSSFVPPVLDRARYADALNDALERLAGHGPQWGGGLAFHAPMAAEAIAALGYYDEVPGWIERNRTRRHYSGRPPALRPIAADDTAEHKAALGDMRRFTDWAQLFEQELAERPWREVLARWWPDLVPGLTGALGHGLIRTAHAVRGLATVPEPGPAQLHELAQGMALWAAAAASPPPQALPAALPALREVTAGQARAALVDAAGAAAGLLADGAPRPTIPLVHMVTVPMAVDLVMPYLPEDLHPDAYRWGMRASGEILRWFGSHLPPTANGTRPGRQTQEQAVPVPVSVAASVEAAMDTEDEHAIKLADVCVRSAALHADDRPYMRAVTMLVGRLRGGGAIPGGR
jgi:hypothetical protein